MADLSKINDAVSGIDTFAGSLAELVAQVAAAFQAASQSGGQEAVDALAAQLTADQAQFDAQAAILKGLVNPPAA